MLAILAESALRSLVLGGVVWIGLNLLRVRNPNLHMTCWAMVLVASLSMPMLMHWTTVTVTVDALPMPAAEHLWSARNPLPDTSPEPPGASLQSEPGMPATGLAKHAEAVSWQALATAIYALVAGILLLRLAVGIYLTWRLARAAKPMHDPGRPTGACASATSSRGPSRSDRPFCFRRNASIGICASAKRSSPMREPTSSTVISISCCSPRSIVRCSGSVRLHGGISPGWRN
jgi:hypothetical protein